MGENAVQAILDRAWEPAARIAADPEIDSQAFCQCCGVNPGAGVASIPGVPMSIMWCHQCLDAGIVPLWVCFAQAHVEWDDHPDAPPAGREMFDQWWLEWHDRTLARFHVTEEEFWAAINLHEEDEEVCRECGGARYYTTEGSKEACESVGLHVLEDFQDGTCAVECPVCSPVDGDDDRDEAEDQQDV